MAEQRFEYQVDSNRNVIGRDEPAADLLNRWARDGWRCMQIVQSEDFKGRGRGLLFFFERPVG